MKEDRKRKIKYRKNFLPTLIVTIFFWLGSFSIVYFVEPDNFGVIPVFFVVFFLSLFFTFSTIFANTRRGAIISLSFVIFLFLKYLGIGNILNAILISGIAITTEVYFIKQG
ncbi:MAG: hypothetical protein ABIJ05_03680 [Patescibacteria group bacterium]